MPKIYRITNVTRGVQLADNARIAETFTRRLVGLLNRKLLSPGEGLVIRPCNSVHTVGMRFPIDVLFLDRDRQVVHVLHGMAPNLVTWIIRGAKEVVELPAGIVLASSTVPGDTVAIEER